MINLTTPDSWWAHLEPQWKEAFGGSILRHSNAPNAEELSSLYHLQTIRLTGPTAPFPNMRFELSNLSGVASLTNLTILVVTHHKIENIEVLANLPGLNAVFLMNNSITSLSGIEALTGLQKLYVQCNRISSIKPIEQLTQLQEFYINNNLVDSLDGLTEKHSDKLNMFVCRPNERLKQKEIIRAERELGIICKGL